MVLVCAGDVASFNKTVVQLSVAALLSVPKSKVVVTVSSGSVVADVVVSGSEANAYTWYVILDSAADSNPSQTFGVDVISALVYQPELLASPSPPTSSTVAMDGSSSSGDAALAVAIVFLILAIVIAAIGWYYIVRRKKLRMLRPTNARLVDNSQASSGEAGAMKAEPTHAERTRRPSWIERQLFPNAQTDPKPPTPVLAADV
jgi:hypothetical protein